MSKLVKKAVNIYHNQGAAATVQKTMHFGYVKTMDVVTRRKRRKTYRTLWEEYAFVSNPIFQITSEDIARSNAVLQQAEKDAIKTANWLVPNFDHISFGGIFTIFRFIEKFSKEGVQNRIIIYDYPGFDVSKLHDQIASKFPDLKDYEIIVFDHNTQDVDILPECDIAICSFWISAYLLLKFNKAKRKYYFIQDYEPLFYAGGSTYALAESTYRFGFRGIVNTPGLLAAINQRHGMEGVSFVPAVDKKLYYPSESQSDNKVVRIFFYARPNNPRNAFNLGITIIKQLKEKYGDAVEIVTAGAEWEESAYGLTGKITNLGLIKSLPEVAELYRSCDIGFVYMLSKHPSYQPFEFMASGMATVTNNNEDNLWLLKDGKNCLLSEPSPGAMAEKISLLIDDPELRAKIVAGAQNSIEYDWERQMDGIWADLNRN